MIVLLACSALALLLVPGVAARWGRQLPPAEWARLATTAVLGGAVMFEVSLLLLAAPTVARAAGTTPLASICHHLMGTLAPGGPVMGWIAAAAAAWLGVRAFLSIVRSRRTTHVARSLSGAGSCHRRQGVETIVVPAQHPMAVSVPGRRPIVLLTSGLVRALSEREVTAVVRHEEAHIRHRHHRYIAALATIEAALGGVPFVRTSVSGVRLALERWADEEAAGSDPQTRADVRSALLRTAEAMVAAPSVAAFSTPGMVAERVKALEAPAGHASRQPGLLYGLMAAGAAAVLVSLGGWVGQVHVVATLSGLCRI